MMFYLCFLGSRGNIEYIKCIEYTCMLKSCEIFSVTYVTKFGVNLKNHTLFQYLAILSHGISIFMHYC